jgi:catechol 2,3-dioxygenase-like lactoylglutathione lyase family enzyme
MIERIDHLNLVVRDMAAMIAFYRDVLGLRLTRQATISGPWIDRVTGLEQVTADVAFLEAPSGASIELLKYRQPEGGRPDSLGEPNTLGLRHFAFRVTDIDGLTASLEAASVPLVSPVGQVPAAQVDFADVRKRLVYFHDPEGNLLEFCAYESCGGDKLNHSDH